MRKKATYPIRRYLDPKIHHESDEHQIQVAVREIQPMMTIEDVGLYLKLSEGIVKGLVFRRVLPHIKFGKHIRFRLSDIERYSNEHQRGGQ